MKRLLLCLLLASLCLAGCVHTTTRQPVSSPVGQPANGQNGVRVDVFKDGGLQLYRQPITREKLLRRLEREEGGQNEQRGIEMRSQRAIILYGQPGVRMAELEDLRDFLVRNGVPNVVVVKPRNVYVDVEGDLL